MELLNRNLIDLYFSGNQETLIQYGKSDKSEIKFDLPFMVPDVVYKFKMICF